MHDTKLAEDAVSTVIEQRQDLAANLAFPGESRTLLIDAGEIKKFNIWFRPLSVRHILE
jgi:hypothetical protein